jgi:uncharacterized HAD superfamily protein
MNLNLCIDIDGTITDAYYWLDLANDYFGTSIKPFQVTCYDIHKVLDIPDEDYLKFYEKFGEQMHANQNIRYNADLILWNLNQKYNIFYVTARNKRMEAVTKSWFKEKNLPEGQLHMLGSHYKVDKARELECNIFIEDRYENAIQLASAGFEVLLIDCYYNRLPLIQGITRVYNWVEIYDEIEEYYAKHCKNSIRIA